MSHSAPSHSPSSPSSPISAGAAPQNGRAPREVMPGLPLGAIEPRLGPDMSRTDAYDALAELFLGDGAGKGKAATGGVPAAGAPAMQSSAAREQALPARAATVEGLILGHLPVLATAWATQYARNLAAMTGGAVALIRIRPGEASVDLIGDGAEAVTPAGSLEDAVRAAAPMARAWLVRVDETSEPRLPELWGLDVVTLLTGADEAAVVASYQTMKHLFKPLEDEPQGPEIRLAIMGATAKKAAESAAKLERAAGAFLRRKVSVVGCIAKISGGKMSTIYRGTPAGSVEEVLTKLVPLIRSMPRPVARSAAAVEPRAPVMHPGPAESEPVAKPDVGSVAVPTASASRLGHAAPQRGDASALLASHVRGLTALQAMCPYAPRVQVAADHSGTVHLLARTDEGLDASDAMGQLLTAGAWASMHASVLGLAAKADGARVEAGHRPVLHLFTGDAKMVRYLGDAEVRLHLLARVEVGGQGGWCCADLN